MRRYISYIIFFLLGLAFTAFVYAQGSPSQKWVNAIESYFNGTNYVNVSSTNPLPVSIPSSSPSATNLTQVSSAALSKTNPLLVQQVSSVNAPANPNQFYYENNITSTIGQINTCVVPTSGHTLYVTHVDLQDIETAGTTSFFAVGVLGGVSGGTFTSSSMTAVNTTLSTLTPPVVNTYSAYPSYTSSNYFLSLLNSAPSTITSEAQRSISRTGTAELPIAAAVSSAGQEICFYIDYTGQNVAFTIEGYEQ